jgi:hypothetical protein
MTIKNQNLIQEEIRRRLNSGNACYHSVRNLRLLVCCLLDVKIRIYKTIILPVVLYGCETCPLILREEHTLRVFENRMLRRKFGPKRNGITGGCRKLHNDELHNLYSSTNKNSVALVRKRTIRTERPPLVGEVNANFIG